MPSLEQKANEFAQLRLILYTLELTNDICEVSGWQDMVYCSEQFDMLLCAFLPEMKV